MLFYLTKYSRSDISNIVIELSKVMDGAAIGSYLERLRVVKCVLDTKAFCFMIHPKNENTNWSLKVFCDSDWAGDPDARIR